MLVGVSGCRRSRMTSSARAGWSCCSSLRRCRACCCWSAPTSPAWRSRVASLARREVAIRLALGARGSRVTRQLIAESLLTAIVTMGIAIVLARWWVDAALSIAPAGIPRLHEVAMNARSRVVRCRLALLVTAVGNAVPTFRASRTPIAGALKDGTAVSAGASGRLRAATGGGRDCGGRDVARRSRAIGPDVRGVAAS